MNDINHLLFKQKLFEFLNKTFDLVSTIDHPYVSPPIKAINCHYKLKVMNNRGLKPLICIWDVNFPNINSYRYELILDIGILSSKDKDFFIFSDEFLYSLQKPKLINFSEFQKRIQFILDRLQDLPKELKNSRNKKFIKNLEKIIFIYKEVIKVSKNGTDFYQHLLKNLYILIGFVDLANFFADSSQFYFDSAITKKWIPYCIKNTKNKPYGFLNLLNKGLFKKPYFRSLNIFEEDKLSNSEYVRENIDKILEAITNSNIIPSYEIFFWTLFLADIKHFGNDYGFFNKLNNFIIKNNLSCQINLLQLTEHNKDCQNIIQFEKDRSFNCFLKNSKYIVKRNNYIKNSRISSFPALYCHLGDDLGGIIKDIFENKIDYPLIIKMGE